MSTFNQRFKVPSVPVQAPAADPSAVNAYLAQNGGSPRYFVDPHNAMTDDYLGQVLASLKNGVFTDPMLQARAAQEGLTDPRWIEGVLETRNRLRSGATSALFSNGQLQMIDRGAQTPTGAQSFQLPPPPGGYSAPPPGTPSAGAGTSGYTTADMIRDPYTGELLSRPSYNQRYSTAPKPTPPPNGMGGPASARTAAPSSSGRYPSSGSSRGRVAPGPRPNPQPYAPSTTWGPGPFRSFGG